MTLLHLPVTSPKRFFWWGDYLQGGFKSIAKTTPECSFSTAGVPFERSGPPALLIMGYKFPAAEKDFFIIK